MIIFRYLTREIALTLSSVTGVLLLVFLSNQFVRFLSQAATGKFASTLLLKLLSIEIPHLLTLLLPLGLFLGILLTYGRLYADNEMSVLSACGVSRQQLLTFTLPITGIVVAIVIILSFWLTPKLLTYRNTLLAQSGTAIQLQAALPGRFQETDGGKRIFYVESMSADKQKMKNIFMAQLEKTDETQNSTIAPWIIITAKSGHQMIDRKTGDRFFVSEDGHRYQGTPGAKDFRIVNYKEYGIRIESHAVAISKQEASMSTLALLKTKENPLIANAELQWRIAMPLSALLLALLALPLSHINPRQGRYAHILPGILIYILYLNLLLLGRNWIERDIIHPDIGLWWAHGLMLIAAGVIWINQAGWRYTWQSVSTRWQIP